MLRVPLHTQHRVLYSTRATLSCCCRHSVASDLAASDPGLEASIPQLPAPFHPAQEGHSK